MQGVAVCDVNKMGANHPQWYTHEYCQEVQKLLGVTSGWEAAEPRHSDSVDALNAVPCRCLGSRPSTEDRRSLLRTQRRSGDLTAALRMSSSAALEKEKELDAVVVCTTDNLHAAVSAAAMKKGKHVFCQKPLTHTIYEARRIAEIARETCVATQIAVGNQASEDTRLLCEWIWAGAIGPVREVHNWSSRPFWPQGIDRPKDSDPVPDGLNWDLWLGPAPQRPYNHIYAPFVWRGWTDFGCGALGDMGSYSFDTIFRVLKLEASTSVEASSTERYPEPIPSLR